MVFADAETYTVPGLLVTAVVVLAGVVKYLYGKVEKLTDTYLADVRGLIDRHTGELERRDKVLEDLAATVKKIDDRIARMELRQVPYSRENE